MTKTAQNWLDTAYPDKTVSEIKLYVKNSVEELTGELLIEGYTKVERIDFERWDKKVKDKITKVTINNCPQIKKVKFNNNEITEIIFQGTFPNLNWLELPDNKLVKVDVSKLPNLIRLNVTRNPNLTEIEGWENLTKLEIVNLFDTPGLNGKKFKEWRDAINSALGSTSQDGRLPDDWKSKLDDLKNRPTKDDLNNAVKNVEDKFKNHIDPNDKNKLEAAAKDQGMIPKNEFDGVKDELGKWKDKFPNQTPDQVKKEINDLNSKLAAGNSGTSGSGALTPIQLEKINYCDKIASFLRKTKGNAWKDYIDKWEKENTSYIESSKAQIEQVLIKKQ
jgi:hypothetical protein